MTDRVVNQLGWIPYLNLLPFYSELRQLVGDSIKFISGHPSTVNRWLTEGVVDLAPASSIAMLHDSKLKMAIPVGIASEGPVQSVYIGLQSEHRDFYDFIQFRQQTLSPIFRDFVENLDIEPGLQNLRRFARESLSEVQVPNLRLTPASAASAALTEVLLYLWCGDECAAQTMSIARQAQTLGECKQTTLARPMELVIGDEALKRRHEFWQVLDLGQIWYQLTGLPFVFGLWQTADDTLPKELLDLVMRAATMSEKKMRATPEIYFPIDFPVALDGSAVDLRSYWSVIQYGLTPRHLKSLSIYYRLVADTTRNDSRHLIRSMTFHNFMEQMSVTV
jgi:chorismate dehydratase